MSLLKDSIDNGLIRDWDGVGKPAAPDIDAAALGRITEAAYALTGSLVAECWGLRARLDVPADDLRTTRHALLQAVGRINQVLAERGAREVLPVLNLESGVAPVPDMPPCKVRPLRAGFTEDDATEFGNAVDNRPPVRWVRTAGGKAV